MVLTNIMVTQNIGKFISKITITIYQLHLEQNQSNFGNITLAFPSLAFLLALVKS